jgi:ABC-type sugar transport system ATPase subunit
MNSSVVLAARGITKRFGGLTALDGVSFDLRAGEVHALCGENGAGKSTLIRILAGVHAPDAGEVLVDGKPVHMRTPEDARRLGLRFIYQELNLVPKFDTLENITLGMSKQTRAGTIDWSRTRQKIDSVLEQVGIDFPLRTPVEKLSVAKQWLVSIARALVEEARLICMDEPTASLSLEESERLFTLVEDLSSRGVSILYVSHRLEEIVQLCDRVTVFKDGERVATLSGQEITKSRLIRLIAGHDIIAIEPPPALAHVGRPVLSVRNLRNMPVVKGVTFEVRAGEVVGLAGLVGSGRTEVANLIFGVDKPDSGQMLLDGKPLKPSHPRDAINRGIGLVPEERRSQGLVFNRGVGFNLNITALKDLRAIPGIPLVSRARTKVRSDSLIRTLGIKTRNWQSLVSELSGGNQQKVVIGKWLTRRPQLLILDEPTKGVDVGARAEIYHIIRELADGGAGVLVISSENEELVALCNRVIVMVEGRVSGELAGAQITEGAILHLSYMHDVADVANKEREG